MPSLIKRRSEKTGLPPGALVHIGDRKTEQVRITIIDYDETQFQEKEAEITEEVFPFKDTPTVTWINVEGLFEIDTVEAIGQHFALHPLILEDILNTDQRPKMEDFERYIYIVLKAFYYNDASNEIAMEQVSLVLGANFVLSFQERERGVLDPIKERIRSDKNRVRKMGADYLAYALIDVIVDNYFVILEKLGEKIELLEEKLVAEPAPGTLQEIHNLKRALLLLRRSIWPLREIFSQLERRESSLIQKSTYIYIKDVYDHIIQIIDIIETFRDMLSAMLDVYLSSVSNRMNEVMKVLTIIATIFIPLTLIAGIYGMNFKYMPELEWRLGYPVVLLVMIAIGISMVIYFRRKGWM